MTKLTVLYKIEDLGQMRTKDDEIEKIAQVKCKASGTYLPTMERDLNFEYRVTARADAAAKRFVKKGFKVLRNSKYY